MESMIYFTTQLYDSYENQDIEMEAAATKLFAMQSLMDMATFPFQSIGPKTTLDEEITSQNIRDAVQIFGQSDNLDTLKMFLGFRGIQFAGIEMQDAVEEGRNPMLHPELIWQKMFNRNPNDSFKLTQNYIHYLHPSLAPAAERLEISLKRFRAANEHTLSIHGRNIVSAQMDVCRLAQCSTLLYALLAVMSRASRSYCIGLRYADMELITANTFAQDVFYEVKDLCDQVFVGINLTNDDNVKALSKQLFQSKGYFYEHPLKRVF